MKTAYYIKKESLKGDVRVESLLGTLRASGVTVYELNTRSDLQPDTDLLLSFGGDGTFLSAAHRVADAGVPILGINLGRLGFLSSHRIEEVATHILAGDLNIKQRTMLEVTVHGCEIPNFWPYAVNEAGLHRADADTLGIDASIDGVKLPTYWADGLIVATATKHRQHRLQPQRRRPHLHACRQRAAAHSHRTAQPQSTSGGDAFHFCGAPHCPCTQRRGGAYS